LKYKIIIIGKYVAQL